MEPHPRICGWTRPKDWRSWVARRASICCASSPRRARRSCGSSARSCSPRCKPMLVDAHAHLDTYSDRAEVVARAKAAGLVHVVAVGQWLDGGVIHCFTSDWPAAQRYLAMGMYLSFSGVLTFRNAEEVRDAAARAPLDRILVETDCPFLAPVPHRGKRNEPAHVALTAAELA